MSKYVASRSILKSCDIYSKNPVSSISNINDHDFTSITDSSIIYICNSAISQFTAMLDKITCKVILVSGDADGCSPVDFFPNVNAFLDFINSDKIIHWFSQNCIIKHDKLSQIPIGLDLHTMAEKDHEWGKKTSSQDQELILEDIKKNSKLFYDRKIMCYANFQFLMTTRFGRDRVDAINNIPKNLVYYEPTKVDRFTTWNRQTEYAFVVSPHGNGLDCHRTWEALCLGCIAIVKTSPLDSLFEDLPVLVVKNWGDINKKLLEDILVEYKDRKFNYNKLLLSYWMDKINKKKINTQQGPL